MFDVKFAYLLAEFINLSDWERPGFVFGLCFQILTGH